ncbi:MAG TPA: hypothetical protein VL948_12930 [Verrucomicrobiae bacterium]|jgi:hypothetical protein|nr:hypothetical protein [Verrucomicrobiae bacterium]
MTTTAETNEMLSQMTGATVELFTLFADANQKILRELVDFSATAAKEGVRLYAELQSSAVEALRDGQTSLLRRQIELQGAPEPAVAYQRGVQESVDGAQRVFRLVESNAQAMTRSAERLQVSAEHASQEIQATVAQLAGRLPALYTPRG